MYASTITAALMAKIVTTTPHVDVINNHFFWDVPVEGAQVRQGVVTVEELGISAILK